MKKIVIVLFFIIALSATASAQITIAGQNFSMLVVVPLILMVIFMVIFGIVIAVDKHREKKEREMLRTEVEKENHKYGIMGETKKETEEKKTEMKEDEKKEKKEKEGLVEEHKPLADYFDDIRDFKKRFKKLDADNSFKQLVALIRNFFSDYLGIDYEFTFDELENELRARNKDVVFFSKNLSDMCYDAQGISKKKVAKLLEEFEDVAEKIILKEEIAIEKGGIKKETFIKKPEAKKIGLREEREREEAKKTEYVNEEKKSRIIGLIREGRGYIKRDINKANNIYEEIYVIYHQLPNQERKELQQKIMEFYNAIRMELKS